MELGDAIRKRSMCRNFTAEPVPRDAVDRLFDRARRAPSAGNAQGWSFVVLQGPGETSRFWEANSDPGWLADPSLPGLLRADLLVVPLCSSAVYIDRYSEPNKIAQGLTSPQRWPAPFWTVDVAFATMLLLLGVVEEGLGALFFGIRRERHAAVRTALGIPDEWSPIGAVCIGWPGADRGPRGSASRPRRPVSEIVHRGGW
jgi:nitroreductase